MTIARRANELVGNGKLSKEKRYNWDPIEGEPGLPELIHKDNIEIDPSYQRDPTSREGAIIRIAAHWNWAACGVLVIFRREDGTNVVIDGGGRLMAALKRSDISFLPCIVYPSESTALEAKAFLVINTERRPITSIQKFPARIVSNDQNALLIRQLLDESGYEISASASRGRVLKCVTAMDRCITERKDIFLRVWPLIIEVARDGPVHEILLQAIFHLEKRIAWMGASLVKQPWKERVLRLGPPGIEDAAKGAAAYFKRGGPKVFARGLRDALNHGTRKRLMFEGQSDEDDD